MAKILTLLIILSLRLLQGDHVQKQPGLTDCALDIIKSRAELISFTGTLTENKILLQWIINKNETADRFEIEKSTDKKNFSLAALVFCSEKTDTDHYKFLEPISGKRTYYRIRIIGKDGSVICSSALEIDPRAKPESTEQTKTNSHADYC